MKFILRISFKLVRAFAKRFGYMLVVKRLPSEKSYDNDCINLNIAAGSNVIPGFKSLDFYTPHYYRSREDFMRERIEYDLRKDSIIPA